MCGAELHSLPEGVQRVSRVLQDAGHPHSPRMLDDAMAGVMALSSAVGVGVVGSTS